MNGPYHLIPLTVLLLILYLLGSLLVRLSMLSPSVHLKIWNSALLASFLGTGILGILVAIQVSYKLEWSITKELLQWHVHAGIALTFVAFIHFLRHTRYYLRIFRSENIPARTGIHQEVVSDHEKTRLQTYMIWSGFLSTCIQVLLIREITTVFQGNELMMSWTLGAWMLLTGAGAYWSRFSKGGLLSSVAPPKAILLLVILPVCLVPLMEILKSGLFLPGVMVSPGWFLVSLLLILAPVCFLTGCIYSVLVRVNPAEKGGFSRVYALEALGSLAGGLVVSFMLVQWFSVFQSLLVLFLLTSVLFVYLKRERVYFITTAIACIVTALSFLFHSDTLLKSFLFVNQHVLESRETRYGNLTVTENSGQYNFFVNGTLLSCSDDPITSEEYAHYAMMQHADPKSVLLVSGSATGILAELLKYKSVASIECMELNPEITELASRYLSLPSDHRIRYLFDDGRRSIRNSSNKYDVVIFAIPEPSSLQFNRYYTDEFLSMLKQKLNTAAVILYGLPSSGNYLSEGKRKIETTVFQTLSRNFMCVEIIPGEKDYFLASDFALKTDISVLQDSAGIDTKYVNSFYTDDQSIRQRGKNIRENLGEKIINQDERPLPVFYHTMQFISGFSSGGWLIILVPALLLLIPLLFMRTVAIGMYLSGFTASSFEILLIFTFQTYFGYVYAAIGLIIALFMGGLVLGTRVADRFTPMKKHYVLAQILLSLCALLFTAFWNIQSLIRSSLAGLLLFCLITLLISMITGFQYVAGTKILPGNFTQTAPMLYSVDLIGAALGTIVITLLLLPLAGVIYSCFILAALNLLISALMALKKN